mmetsp:Transcript_2049/g.2234  ORF Transcript_2049/g.2234 Transcript_2049/m.2234 type:complete len:149 (+) Transcript_2049:226-672(+)
MNCGNLCRAVRSCDVRFGVASASAVLCHRSSPRSSPGLSEALHGCMGARRSVWVMISKSTALSISFVGLGLSWHQALKKAWGFAAGGEGFAVGKLPIGQNGALLEASSQVKFLILQASSSSMGAALHALSGPCNVVAMAWHQRRGAQN